MHTATTFLTPITWLAVAATGLAGCAQPEHHVAGGTFVMKTTAPATTPVTDKSRLAQEIATAAKLIDTSACDGKEVEVLEERNDKGVVIQQQYAVKGKDGKYIEHGKTTMFWGTGQPKLEVTYICGLKNGLRTSWFNSGKTWSEGSYINGKEHGTWKVYGPDGKLTQRFTLNHGQWNGQHTFWYSNGQKRMNIEWVKGQRQGPLRAWNPEGKLIRHVDYANDVPQPTPFP